MLDNTDHLNRLGFVESFARTPSPTALRVEALAFHVYQLFTSIETEGVVSLWTPGKFKTACPPQ